MKRLTLLVGGMLAAAMVAACGTNGNGDASVNWSSSASTSSTTLPSASPEPSAPTASQPTTKVQELADNKNGLPVFKGTDGAAAPDNVPGRIPYGTPVDVDCYADNTSGMSSINYFYHIVGGKWNGLYAPANTFDNGAGLGPNSVNLDSRVRKCAK